MKGFGRRHIEASYGGSKDKRLSGGGRSRSKALELRTLLAVWADGLCLRASAFVEGLVEITGS